MFPDDLNPHAYIYEVGEGETIFTDGFDTFEALANDDVTIQSIRSVGDTPGVEVLGVLVSGPLGENGTVQSFDSFPPTNGLDGELREAEGALIPAGSGYYQILIGYRTDISDLSVRSGIEVTYRIGDRTYTRTLPAGIVMCPPAAESAACDREMNEYVQRHIHSQD